ncbi:uncharacterized protein [Henckelia pumila]|uniref:uncharacterized protein n=1 Tax=Henckelia pumila TaxID=405737 RepID=UPI003C6E7B5C
MAAARNSSSSYKFHTWVTLLYRTRVVSSGLWLSRQAQRPDLPPCRGVSVDQGLRFLTTDYSTAHLGTKLAIGKYTSAERVQASFSAHHENGFSNWMKWILGSLLSLVLPLLGKTWNDVRRLEGKVEVAAEEVDTVAEVVESVATAADKALKEVAEDLPNGKFKEAAEVMEHLCFVAAQDSILVQNLIHKAGEVKQDLEDMDAMVQAAVGNVQSADETKKSI